MLTRTGSRDIPRANVLARCRVKVAPEITGSPSYVMGLVLISTYYIIYGQLSQHIRLGTGTLPMTSLINDNCCATIYACAGWRCERCMQQLQLALQVHVHFDSNCKHSYVFCKRFKTPVFCAEEIEFPLARIRCPGPCFNQRSVTVTRDTLFRVSGFRELQHINATSMTR